MCSRFGQAKPSRQDVHAASHSTVRADAASYSTSPSLSVSSRYATPRVSVPLPARQRRPPLRADRARCAYPRIFCLSRRARSNFEDRTFSGRPNQLSFCFRTSSITLRVKLRFFVCLFFMLVRSDQSVVLC